MVQHLEYNVGLTLQQAGEKIKEVVDAFYEVRSHYANAQPDPRILGIFRRKMSREDQKTLSDCLGVLLPLGLEECVQKEIVASREVRATIHYQAGMLFSQIGSYLAKFRNTGVKELNGDLGW